ncbi:hypothetical protein BT63DRAFT_463244 [Microthyrium microscopicum]|uniref:RTA1-domain-containing protein n=1 Tax=Microthyrium microscopicum TaxID=703497 RepID=A0A6A6U477_9PEZI|nr:hypothetical protein BT63DRAFT_463244 [Microthyrium microscopicum]
MVLLRWTALTFAFMATQQALALPQSPATSIAIASPVAPAGTIVPSGGKTSSPAAMPQPSQQTQAGTAQAPAQQSGSHATEPASAAGAAGAGGIAGAAVAAGAAAAQPQSPFIYMPSFSMAAAGALVFLISATITNYQFFTRKAWNFMLMPQGAVVDVVGAAARVYAVTNFSDKTAFIVQMMGFQIAPALVTIQTMMVFTRVIWWVTPIENLNSKVLGLPHRHLTFLWALGFVIPDLAKAVVSQLDKPKPGAHPNPKGMGNRIEQICLIFQFFAIAGWSLWATMLMRRARRWIVPVELDRVRWHLLGWTCVASGFLLSWRVMYFTFEKDALYDPKAFISQHEWPFWMLGQLPILLVYTLFQFNHPGDYIPREYTRFKFDVKKLELMKREETWRPNISHPVPSSPQSDPDPKGFEVNTFEITPHPGRKM